jgi:hypothetical protein
VTRQFLTKVAGRSGARVDHLIISSGNKKIDGGGGGGSQFEWVPAKNNFMLGFAGRSGNELDQIQFVFGKFDPATWTLLKLNSSKPAEGELKGSPSVICRCALWARCGKCLPDQCHQR